MASDSTFQSPSEITPAEMSTPEVLLLVGPPGAGKGTQAEKLARARRLKKLSTGDTLRDHVKRGTELGVQAKAIMDAGELVPDAVIVGMVRAEVAGMTPARVLLDGFPRTAVQAEALDALLTELNATITAAVLLEVDTDELVARLVKRAEEQGRTDDNEDTIRRRMNVYSEQTAPLISYYEATGKLRRVDGIGSVEEVFARISEVLP